MNTAKCKLHEKNVAHQNKDAQTYSTHNSINITSFLKKTSWSHF